MRDFATFVELYWDDMQNWSVLLETTNRWDDAQCQVMISSVTWLTTFIDGSHDVQPALSALSAWPNNRTRLLLRFLRLLDNHTIVELWKTKALVVQSAVSRVWKNEPAKTEWLALCEGCRNG
jgi:hypothetical protein